MISLSIRQKGWISIILRQNAEILHSEISRRNLLQAKKKSIYVCIAHIRLYVFIKSCIKEVSEMDLSFWIDIQKSWRRTVSEIKKAAFIEHTASLAMEWGNETITNSYSKNPLDDIWDGDDDDEDDY